MRTFLFILLVVCTALPAHAQEYPARPVHFVVPYTPGTGADILARLLGPKLREKWNVAVVTENKPGATGNIVYEKAVLAMRDEVSTGQRLQRAMENTGIFPNMVIQMIAVGEESGSLDEMSSKVADFYEADVDNAVDSMSSLLEPLIMAILGVLVGGLVIAMYLPIFKLGAVV